MIGISFFQTDGRLVQHHIRHTDICRFYSDGIVEIHCAKESIDEVAAFEIHLARRCCLDSLDSCIVAGGTGYGGIRVILRIPLIGDTR